jgi:hypothetical protein
MGAGFFFPKLWYQKFGEFFQNFSKIIEFVVEQKHLPKTPNYFVEKNHCTGVWRIDYFYLGEKKMEGKVRDFKHDLIFIKCRWSSNKRSECRDVLELLAGYGEPLSPIASAFQDLWIRAISVMPEGWSLRFAKVLQRDVFANFLESLNLHHNICPSVSAYTQERRSNGIVIPPIVCKHVSRLWDAFVILLYIQWWI